MKFVGKQDIEAPIAQVFAELNDFAQFERMAVRYGADIERIAESPALQPGAAWRVAFPYRGKTRHMVIRLAELTHEQQMVFTLESANLAGEVRMEFLALAAKRTRLSVTTNVTPRSLTARLVLQSLRLARGRVQKRLDEALRALAKFIIRKGQISAR